MVCAWRNFKFIFPKPLFTIIFRPKMIKFHPYSILTGEGKVDFLIYCMLIDCIATRYTDISNLIIWANRHFHSFFDLKTDKTIENNNINKDNSIGFPNVCCLNRSIERQTSVWDVSTAIDFDILSIFHALSQWAFNPQNIS